ncbi:MAG: hypothetical protein WC205_01190 [Opitutaceae bacterium]|jgi:hypothetical protein
MHAAIERRVEQRFAVPEAAVLRLDTSYGTVNIREVPDTKIIEVVITQTAEVDTEQEMDGRLRMLDLKMDQRTDGTVMLSAQFRRSLTWSWKSWPPVTLAYEIQVPKRCDVDIHTGDGRITVGALEGRVVLGSEHGAIFTSEIDGTIKARSRTGSVSITACTGEIDASTDVGNLTVGRAGGRTVLSSDGGYIDLQRASGEVVVRGNGSDAQVGFVPPILHSADIVTSGGSVVLLLNTTAACTLDLKSSIFGHVSLRGELPLVVTRGGRGTSSLEGAVNGGGPRILASASGGNVQLRALAPVPVIQ